MGCTVGLEGKNANLSHFIPLRRVTLKRKDVSCFFVLFGSGYELKCSRATCLLSKPFQISSERGAQGWRKKERPMPWVLCTRSVKKFLRLENFDRSRGLNAFLLGGRLSGYTVTVASLDGAAGVLVMVASLSCSWSEFPLPANTCHDVVIRWPRCSWLLSLSEEQWGWWRCTRSPVLRAACFLCSIGSLQCELLSFLIPYCMHFVRQL